MSKGFYTQARSQPQQCCENRDDYDPSGASRQQQRQEQRDSEQRCVTTPANHTRSILNYMQRLFPLRAADSPPYACRRDDE